MEEMLWTFEDVVRFVDHPDRSLRLWALERLTNRFPDQAGDVLAGMLSDEGRYLAQMAARFLGKTGDREQYGPALLERFRAAEPDEMAAFADALARLGYREALPYMLELFDEAVQHTGRLDDYGLLGLVGPVGRFGGEEARRLLWSGVDRSSGARMHVNAMMEALLTAAMPGDIARLVQRYRSWPSTQISSRVLDAFASAIGAWRLASDLMRLTSDGMDAMLEQAERWLACRPALSDVCLQQLRDGFERQHEGVFDVLHEEALSLIAERQDDVGQWMTEWQAGERPAGYRREALFVPLILEAFAVQPSAGLTQRMSESAMGLALLCQFSVNSDDQGRLDAAADRTDALLSILSEDREHVLPNIVEQVSDLGPDVVPRLLGLIRPDDYGWGLIRTIDAIALLARRHPGSCDAGVERLIDVMHDEQGDFALESGARALAAIGPAAVGPIVEHLRDGDDTRQLYLIGVLSEIPTKSAAQGILAVLEDGEPFDEHIGVALANIGSPSAIEPLYDLWKLSDGQDTLLAEYLLMLCELNGVSKPELPMWRKITRSEEERIDRLIRGDLAWPSRAQPPGPTKAKSKGVSKRERKKRAAQRKQQRKGKKKRR